jgi:hypothetical protein
MPLYIYCNWLSFFFVLFCFGFFVPCVRACFVFVDGGIVVLAELVVFFQLIPHVGEHE